MLNDESDSIPNNDTKYLKIYINDIDFPVIPDNKDDYNFEYLLFITKHKKSKAI